MTMAAKQDQLRARHDDLINSERQKRLRDEYAEVAARRDALVADLREHWPMAAATLVELIARVQASDEEIARINAPSGCDRLESAEVIARECPGNFYASATPITRFAKAKIPALIVQGSDHMAWPRPNGEPLWMEADRRTLIAAKAHQIAESERWQDYIVTAPTDQERELFRYQTRRGPQSLRRGGQAIGKMTEEFVQSARKAGLNVSRAKPGATVGLPSAAAFV